FLDEYTKGLSQAPVQSIPLPTVDSGSNHVLTSSGTATSEGLLAVSANGHYLTVTGYDATPGTAGVASTASATTPRVVALIDSNGTGLPTTGGQTSTELPGFPTSTTGHSPYEFIFKDASTVYVADDGTTANGGGLQKWTLSGGTWTLAYTLSPGTNIGLRGL